jgi:hypothetical protein
MSKARIGTSDKNTAKKNSQEFGEEASQTNERKYRNP